MKTSKTIFALSIALGSFAASTLNAQDVATYHHMKNYIGRASVKVQNLRGNAGGGSGGVVNPGPGSTNPFPGGGSGGGWPTNPGGGSGGGWGGGGSGGGFQPFNPNNPWGSESDLEAPAFADFNENDFLAGSTLARAGQFLGNAGLAADQMLANLQAGNFSNAVAFFGRACSQLGMARLSVSTANFQAGQPPLGILAQWGADFRDVIDLINFARTSGSATCP